MEGRKQVYEDALVKWGKHNQLVVAIEDDVKKVMEDKVRRLKGRISK